MSRRGDFTSWVMPLFYGSIPVLSIRFPVFKHEVIRSQPCRWIDGCSPPVTVDSKIYLAARRESDLNAPAERLNQADAIATPIKHPNSISPSETGAFLYPNSACKNLVRRKKGFTTFENHKTLVNIIGDPTGNRTRATIPQGGHAKTPANMT